MGKYPKNKIRFAPSQENDTVYTKLKMEKKNIKPPNHLNSKSFSPASLTYIQASSDTKVQWIFLIMFLLVRGIFLLYFIFGQNCYCYFFQKLYQTLKCTEQHFYKGFPKKCSLVNLKFWFCCHF